MAAFDTEKIELVRKQLEEVMRSVVDKTESLHLTVRQGDQTVVFVTSCDASDTGKLIGREGRMASSLRTLLISYSTRMGFRAVLEIG